jgi:hypothetical protein
MMASTIASCGKFVDLSSMIHAVVAVNMISFCFDKNDVLSREVAGVPFSFPMASKLDSGDARWWMAAYLLLARPMDSTVKVQEDSKMFFPTSRSGSRA